MKASATFANGSTWTADFGVTAHSAELSTETNAYENIHAWLDCEGGWKTLPSGKVIDMSSQIRNIKGDTI